MSPRAIHKLIALSVGWLVAATVVMAVPMQASALQAGTSATDAAGDGRAGFGQRLSDGGRVDAAVAGFRLAADVPEICETVPDAGPACDPDNDPDATPDEPTPEPEPSPTPRDPYADAAESAAAGRDAVVALIEEPHWIIHPPDDRQIVGLKSFLYIQEHFDIQSALGPDVGGQQVAVTAVPQWSKWKFREKDTGATSSVSCMSRGELWAPGKTDPTCGKSWFHSSDVTGKVELEVCVEYAIAWNHAYASGGESFEICSSSPGELTVLEVMTWGIDQLDVAAGVRPSDPVVHEPKIECSWKAKVVAWVLPGVGCEPIQRIGELISNFLDGCGGAIVDKFTDLWGVITGFGSDPVGYVKEQIAGLQAMYDQLMDPETRMEMIEALGRDILYFEEDDVISEFTADDWAEWGGKVICGFAFDYLSGTATGKIFDWLSGRLPNRPDGPDIDNPNNPDPDAPDNPDPDNPDPDNPDPDPDNDGPTCLTPQSSFPAGTQVVMDDGGLLAIELIRPGDRVLSYDVDTSVWEPKLVLDQWSHHDRGPPTTAYLHDGSSITATNDHRFYAPATNEWIELQHLRSGDEVLTPDGPITLATVTTGPAHPWTVWELTVAENHNFTVVAGDTPILVHNQGQGHGPCNPNAGVPEGGTATSWDGDGNPLTYKDEDGNIHDLRTPGELAARADEILEAVLNGDDVPVLGRFPEVADAGAVDGQWNLNVDDWSPELNDAVMDALIEAGEPIKLVSDPFDPRHVGSVFERELERLEDAGWNIVDNGDGTWTAKPPSADGGFTLPPGSTLPDQHQGSATRIAEDGSPPWTADPRLPERVDNTGPTTGIVEYPGGQEVLYRSGVDGPAFDDYYDPDRNDALQSATHVEGHVAADMAANGITEATVTINHVGGPCNNYCGGSATNDWSLASRILPEGSILHVRYWSPATDSWVIETIRGQRQ